MNATGRMDASPDDGFERHWFAAGDRLLAIDSPAADAPIGAETRPFADALLLDAHAALLDCLDDCLGESHDWRPDEHHDAAFALTLVEPATDGAARRVALASPSAHAPDTAALGGGHRRWSDRILALPHGLSAELLLDRLTLDEEDLGRLAVGSVVLLPTTFADGAARAATLRSVAVSAAETPGGGSAADGSSASGAMPSDASREGDGRGVCEIVLDERFAVTAEALEAARDEGSRDAHVTLDASLALDDEGLARASAAARDAWDALPGRRGRLRRDDGGCAVGELVALGAGLGLVVDGVDRWT